MPSSASSSSSASGSTTSSSRRVAFSLVDAVVSSPPTSEGVPEASGPSLISPAAPPSSSSTSTASNSSVSGPTPSPQSEGKISLRQGGIKTNPNNLTPLQEALESLILNPNLSTSQPVEWDMLINPQTQPQLAALSQVGDEPMTNDEFPESISEIRIRCDILPWPIIMEIQQDGSDHTPRIDDIFRSIYASLSKWASEEDFEAQTRGRKRRIKEARRARCDQLSLPYTEGLKRIDFLESKTKFSGLSPGDSHEEWYLHVG